MSDELTSLSQSLTEAVEATAPSVVRVEAGRRRPSSGVAWSKEGLILATSHSVEIEEGIAVSLDGQSLVPAELVGRDPSTDVAVLRVQATLPTLTWAEASTLKVGQLVLALGRPGRTTRARLGIVSSLSKDWQ